MRQSELSEKLKNGIEILTDQGFWVTDRSFNHVGLLRF